MPLPLPLPWPAETVVLDTWDVARGRERTLRSDDRAVVLGLPPCSEEMLALWECEWEREREGECEWLDLAGEVRKEVVGKLGREVVDMVGGVE